MKNKENGGKFSFMEKFCSEDSCWEYLKQIRWGNNPVCPFCNHNRLWEYKDKRNFKCKSCKKIFKVTKGTIFEGTKIPLKKWFWILYDFANNKKGLPIPKVVQDYGIAQSNVFNMFLKIRQHISQLDMFKGKFKGEIEIDEAFFGGLNKNRHYNKRIPNSQGRSTKAKSAILAITERGGRVVTYHLQKLKKKGLQTLIKMKVDKDAIISTDEYRGYIGLGKHFHHQTVNHGAYKYVVGTAHTNSVEGFWSGMKKGIKGVYHHASRKYMILYSREYAFKYNTRNYTDTERFDEILGLKRCPNFLNLAA